ncbi:hypothetical protein AMS68_005447 [Peltaster fructicola]|uniref:NAD(P)-binding domain-containing protein n=1 Tax=Peltaster fructicola TaxID=286661 RepID=A0A6H0XZU4_9PEZI|nr:hypothetical protein AMS68_005447 [Peltaster fructicola]
MSRATLSTAAFFGATGDCAGYCLANALKAGHRCVALARTPAKLTASMKAKDVPEAALTNLTIIQGDVRDQKAVESALRINGVVVDTIISSVGSVPALRWSLTSPVSVVDATLCGDAAKVLVSALRSLKPAKKPVVVVVSTTGLKRNNLPRDVPLAYVPLYHWLLHVPHIDKANMEKAVRDASAEPAGPLERFVAIKPTLLMDGPSRGSGKLRVGTDEKPALGYAIRRSEVGQWIYENVIAQEVKPAYIGKGISLTA